MNKISTNQKTTRHKSQILDRVQSAGLEGIAIAPPAYGIDAIDNEASGAQISEILNSEAVAQRKAQVSGAESDGGTRTESSTGLPDALKKRIERLSGYSLDGVRVHYNSSRPAQVEALAFTQGTEIHIAPGQERTLAHEAWHVVQQAQGRVKPTMQTESGAPVNDDTGLEQEADVMGAKVLKGDVPVGKEALPAGTEDGESLPQKPINLGGTSTSGPVIQRTSWYWEDGVWKAVEGFEEPQSAPPDRDGVDDEIVDTTVYPEKIVANNNNAPAEPVLNKKQLRMKEKKEKERKKADEEKKPTAKGKKGASKAGKRNALIKNRTEEYKKINGDAIDGILAKIRGYRKIYPKANAGKNDGLLETEGGEKNPLKVKHDDKQFIKEVLPARYTNGTVLQNSKSSVMTLHIEDGDRPKILIHLTP